VLVGALAGFGGMCVLGRIASRENHLNHFVRFTQWTSPETKYYPTIGEMMSVVRAQAKPEQILVIVGGNSVLRGVGQPVERIWTRALQQNLGPGYCVINFAFNGSGITDAASVAAEALRHEYPRQIYIANAAPAQPPAPDGTGLYRFVFWEAYYKGLLIDDPVRAAAIVKSNEADVIQNPEGETGLREMKIREWLDSFFYFQDFWNWFTYKQMNTVWGFYMPGTTDFLLPRKRYKDPEPDLSTFPMDARYLPGNLAVEMSIVRGFTQYVFMSLDQYGHPQKTKDASGKWQPYVPVWDYFNHSIRVAMPDELKKRTLILLSRSSPFYLKYLTPDEKERDELAYEQSMVMWKAAGFDAMDYGKNFTAEEYADRTHVTWQGGAKLAPLVADKVREMSQNLGYLQK
jgi:hypothetical protein